MGEPRIMDLARAAALEVAEAEDCYCAKTRKRCSYHEGYEDGYDHALRVVGNGRRPNDG